MGYEKNVSQCLMSFLFVSLVFSAISPVSTQLQENPIQDTMDTHNSIQDNFIEPLGADSIVAGMDSESFHFPTKESVSKQFAQPNTTDSTLISLEAPTNYTDANLSFAFDIIGNGSSELLIGEDATIESWKEAQAQSFNITNKVWVEELAILLSKAPTSQLPNVTIRQENLSGEVIYNAITQITADGWINLLPDKILLNPGVYYLVLEGLGVGAQYKMWQKTDINTTHTVYYDSGWVSADFDLSLRLNMIGFIEDVSTVEVYVNTHAMQYDANNTLWQLELATPVVNQSIELAITSNITAIYTYDIVATYFQDGLIHPTLEILPEKPNELFYNFSLDLVKLSSEYKNYQVVVGGVYPDFFNIQILKNGSDVSYQRISLLEIEFSEDADHLEFFSLNAIQEMAVLDTNFIGDVTQTNVSTEYSGNLTLNIYDGVDLVYSNTSETSGFASFTWKLEPPLVEQNLHIEATFTGQNHAGWSEEIITLMYHTSISASPLIVYAFDEITLECDYDDLVSNETVDNASVSFNFESISGSMERSDFNGYQATLDLNLYNFLPGNYTITYYASREGYSPQTIQQQIEIRPRVMDISIIQNTDRLEQKDQLRFTIFLEDATTNNGLLRTADIKISIYTSNGHSDLIIYSETAKNVEYNYTINFPIETDFEPGNYSLTIEILSEYYEGIYAQTVFFEILVPENFPFYYLLVIVPLLGIGTGMLIAHIKKIVKHSLAGLLILHENGVLIGEKIESDFSQKDPLLISGVISGMIILVQEITGGRLKTLEIDGGYMSLARGDQYWVVIFIRKNPVWIKKTIKNLIGNISEEFGHEIMNYTGERIPISLDNLTFKYFGKIIMPDFNGKSEDSHINVQNTEEILATSISETPHQPMNETDEESLNNDK